jgi:protein-tyrosine phosphatase
MVDLHHHLLPGLDDGSPDIKTSVAMSRMAVEDGITHVVATPHASGTWTFEPDVIAAKLAELRQALAQESIALTLATGCDFHLSYDNIQDGIANPRKYTLNGSQYVLVELPDFGLSPSLGEIFFDLRVAGMVPILTHPERNPTLQRDQARLADWMRDGLLVQVTAGSVLGHMGKEHSRWRIPCWLIDGCTSSLQMRTIWSGVHRGCGRLVMPSPSGMERNMRSCSVRQILQPYLQTNRCLTSQSH